MKQTRQLLQRNERCGTHHKTSAVPMLPEVINHDQVRVQNISLLATTVIIQENDHSWDAIVTAQGKGTYLIRRRKFLSEKGCTLLSCEVRRIDASNQSITNKYRVDEKG